MSTATTTSRRPIRRDDRAGTQAQAVPLQHPQSALAVEGVRTHPRAVREPCLPRAQAAARDVSQLRHLQPSCDCHRLSPATMLNTPAGAETTSGEGPLAELVRVVGVELDR